MGICRWHSPRPAEDVLNNSGRETSWALWGRGYHQPITTHNGPGSRQLSRCPKPSRFPFTRSPSSLVLGACVGEIGRRHPTKTRASKAYDAQSSVNCWGTSEREWPSGFPRKLTSALAARCTATVVWVFSSRAGTIDAPQHNRCSPEQQGWEGRGGRARPGQARPQRRRRFSFLLLLVCPKGGRGGCARVLSRTAPSRRPLDEGKSSPWPAQHLRAT